MSAKAPHMHMERVGKPPVDAWRCVVCGEKGTLAEVRASSCAKANVGTMTGDEQLRRWADGESVCPNDRGECCPDFSCCRPQLQWSEAKRRAFLAADEGSREKMLMGALGSLAEDEGAKVYVTRGVPEDHQ